LVDVLYVFKEVPKEPIFRISLIDMCIAELWRQSLYIYYLTIIGLYRNAFESIRYVFESMLQSIYIDSRHPNASMRTRIEILKEVEDKREYRAQNLISELDIGHKDTLKRAYKKLSRAIHPSHQNIVALLETFMKGESFVSDIDCYQILGIYEHLKIVFDIVLFLYISQLPEKGTLRKRLKKNTKLGKLVRTYNLILLSKVLKIRLRKEIIR
jgi:hypothetical protein